MMGTENFARAGRNSPVMQCETGILKGHLDEAFWKTSQHYAGCDPDTEQY
jgi:hypothetical protein